MGDHVELRPFLRAFGYLDTAADDLRPAVERYQLVHGLAVTGEADAPTVAMMAMPRCGVPDVDTAVGLLGVGDTWPQRALTYGFDEVTAQLGSEANATDAITEALRLWSEVTPLTFRKVPLDEEPDFVVRFVVGAHGDGFAFDGPGRVLAHAFYPPPNGGAIAGDAHFDDTERWAVELPVGSDAVDLVTVAAHEFGHSLGLDHSADVEAIMFPVILGTRRFLGDDDVARIQALYGAPDLDGAVAVAGGGAPDLVYTAPDRLDLFLANAMGGRRRRRFRSGRWERWEELGGEADTEASVNLRAVPLDPGGAVAVLSRDSQRNVRSIVVDDAGAGPASLRPTARAASYFATGDAGGVGVYVTSSTHPGTPDESPARPNGALYEAQLVDGGLTEWVEVEADATSVAEVVGDGSGTGALFVADSLGRMKVADGAVGSWGPFRPIDDGERIDPRTPFWTTRACFSGGELHVVMVTAEFRLLHRVRRGGAWSPWDDLGAPWTRPRLVESGPGRVHALANERVGPGAIATFDGSWSGWSRFGGERKVAAVAATTDRVDVVLREPQRLLHVVRSFP